MRLSSDGLLPIHACDSVDNFLGVIFCAVSHYGDAQGFFWINADMIIETCTAAKMFQVFSIEAGV